MEGSIFNVEIMHIDAPFNGVLELGVIVSNKKRGWKFVPNECYGCNILDKLVELNIDLQMFENENSILQETLKTL